ncbi:MAG: molybdopterin converting factor subunit 1 [Pseudomonadota bacterium]
MIQLVYFARLRDVLGVDREAVDLPCPMPTVGDIRVWLGRRCGPWRHELVENSALCIALNQEYAGDNEAVMDGDVIAFFPPVTGG